MDSTPPNPDPRVAGEFSSPDPRLSIRVVGKDRHPAGFSYPLGANLIAEALTEVPQFEKLTIRFSAFTPLLSLEADRSRFPLLRLTHTNYPVYESRSVSIRPMRQGGEQWLIEVLVVPHALAPHARSLMVDNVLPELKAWLSSDDAPKGNVRKHIRECWVEVSTGQLDWREVTQSSPGAGGNGHA